MTNPYDVTTGFDEAGDENGNASHGVAVVDQRGELFWLAVTDLPFMSVGDVYAVAFNRYTQPKE